ncbi:MAG TPA: DMT family transporter [Gammaproteobacteria bacterium]|nr:DMT family transporter [Gammaproteobacteria bacterium]
MDDSAREAAAPDSLHAPQAHRVSDAGPLAAFAVLALIWGYNWVVMKIALRYAGPIEFALLRVGIAVLVMFALLMALRIPLRPADVRKTIWLGLFQTTGFIGLMSWSLSFGEVGKSAVLAYTMPFWVIVLGWPFLHERLQGRQWPAVGLALVGLVLVLELWAPAGSAASSFVALGAGAAWGISVIIAKKIPVRGRDELLSLTSWQMLFGFIPLAAAALLVEEPPIDWSGYFIGALIFNAVGATAIATLLWLYIVQRLPATVSGLSALIVPIIGVGAAWVQLGERPDLFETIGMALILAALALLASTRRVSAPQ